MKTTLDLPDDLLMAAKRVAVERRTTLKAMVTQSLRREIGMDKTDLPHGDLYEMGRLGFLRLKKRGAKVTSELIDQIREEEGI